MCRNKNDDKSSGAGGSDSKVNSGASNSGIWVVVIIQRPQVAMVETQVQVQVAHHLHLIQEKLQDLNIRISTHCGLTLDTIRHYFDGEFLLFTFKIKDGAANGTYPISFIN